MVLRVVATTGTWIPIAALMIVSSLASQSDHRTIDQFIMRQSVAVEEKLSLFTLRQPSQWLHFPRVFVLQSTQRRAQL